MLTELLDGTQWRCSSRDAIRSRRLTARHRLRLIPNELHHVPNHDVISRDISSSDFLEKSMLSRDNQNRSDETARPAPAFARQEFLVPIFRPVLVRGLAAADTENKSFSTIIGPSLF
jgi:hypothetical protein